MAILYKDRRFTDERCPDDLLFHGAELGVCYTLEDDDITVGKRPASSPYTDRFDRIVMDGSVGYAENTDTTFTVKPFSDGVECRLKTTRTGLSQFGIKLPFNFMGKIGGGGWRNQFLFNSPYVSDDREIQYFYLTKPNGCHLLVAVIDGAGGWKIDYSPYLCGHYFIDLKLLANHDRAYNMHRRENDMTFVILPVNSFDDCLERLAELYRRPFISAPLLGGTVGDRIKLSVYGKVDHFVIRHGDSERISDKCEYTLEHSGETKIYPISGGKVGGGISLYAYDDIIQLYKKSMDSVELSVIEKNTDGNLCEHQCWCSAMLRFLQKYKDKLAENEIAEYEKKILALLDVVTEKDAAKAVRRRTIFHLPHENYPAYNIFESNRVQEQFFGITILLDAYKYFGDEKYYRYAVCTMDSFLDHYQKDDGRIERISRHGIPEDYTTVCCPMIPIVDMANYLKNRDAARSSRYFDSAKRMADYLNKRGLIFPTEGGRSDLAEAEMEDGSISCTALALLYYCKNVERNEEYITKAKEILDIHENWTISSSICQMNRSSLRWWETFWEGDKDGPAICAGHGWTIWRAEADYLYYSLTGNVEYRRRAKSGFLTNLSKIDEKGRSFAIYSPDEITGGGFGDRAEEVKFRIAPKFPDTEDCGLSRYVWIRINDTDLLND